MKNPGIGGDEEEEDDEFAPITEEDLKSLQASKQKAEEDEDEDDDDDEEGEGEDEEEDDDDDEEKEEDDDDDEDEEDSDMEVDGKNVPENFIVAARRALGKAAVVGDEDDDVEMDDEELAEMDKRLADVFQVFTSHSKKMRKFQIAHFRMDVAQLVGLLLLKANSEQRPKLEPHFREFAKESKESGNQDLSKPIREIVDCLEKKDYR